MQMDGNSEFRAAQSDTDQRQPDCDQYSKIRIGSKRQPLLTQRMVKLKPCRMQ